MFLSRDSPADGRRDRRRRAEFSASTNACRSRAPAISSCFIRNGCRAATARAATSRMSPGIKFSANGQPLKWMRDPLDVYAFHVSVPQGVSAVDVDFQYVSATADNQGRTVMTPGHVEHPVAVAVDVSGGLLRPADPGAGVGDRPGRLEGRDRAPPERRKPAAASTIR